MSLTVDQLELRRRGISATDVAAILGLSPWMRPIEVQQRKLAGKRGEPLPPDEVTEAMQLGNHLEDGLRKHYEWKYRALVRPCTTIVHPTIPWAMATPDGVVIDGDKLTPVRGVEIKTNMLGASRDFGDAETDQVPHHYLLQCAWGMACTDLDEWDLVKLGQGGFVRFPIKRDAELEGWLLEQMGRFWQVHVLDEQPLEPDGSFAYSKFLSDKWPDDNDQIVTADADVADKIQKLRDTRATIKSLEIGEATLAQEIKLFIGPNSGVESPEGTITWRRSKDAQKTDWQKAMRDCYEALVNGPVGFRQMVDQIWTNCIRGATESKPGTRRFIVPRSWDK